MGKLHEKNILSLLVTLDIFYLEISGKDFKSLQPENI